MQAANHLWAMTKKWQDRGYWVSKHFYWQSMAHYLWYSLRFRSFTFFSAANPAIPFGGMLNESKEAIDRIIPAPYRPRTVVYDPQQSWEVQLCGAGLSYPLILKPDIGLKGHLVRRINNPDQAAAITASLPYDRQWLLQEYIAFDKEYALLYYHDPHQATFGVLSLIQKCYPTIVGNGRSSITQLIDEHPHPFLDKALAQDRWADRANEILPTGETLTIDTIGNYSRGATFHSMMDLITPALEQRCHELFGALSDLYFFRMDLKTDSIEDFLAGRFKIIEINGAKGEPLHIYDRSTSLWSNARDISRHWRTLGQISASNLHRGYQLPSFSDGMAAVRSVKRMLA